MQPYQQASEEIQRQQSAPGRIAKGIATSALGFAGGNAAFNRIAPFLSKYIPEPLAIKGLSKLDPKMAGFISSSIGQGFSFSNIRDFLGNKGEQEAARENKNIIQKYSPGLHQYISDLIKQGSSPIDAANKAKKFLGKKEQDTITKIEKDYKSDWLSIVESIFGKGDIAQQGMQEQPQQGQSTQQPQQGGGSDDQIISALQNILRM